MINIQQFYKFCNEQNLSAEEASLILAIDQNNSGGEFKLAFSQYMSRESKRFKYKILVPTLIERGFLRNLGDKDKLKLSELRVTDKFRSLLLVDIDEAYN